MILPPPRLAARSFRGLNCMGVVESDKTLATLVMQSQRITQAVRSFGRGVNSLNRKLHPVLPVRIDHEYLAIQVQQRVQAVVAHPVTQLQMLSVSDNNVKLA